MHRVLKARSSVRHSASAAARTSTPSEAPLPRNAPFGSSTPCRAAILARARGAQGPMVLNMVEGSGGLMSSCSDHTLAHRLLFSDYTLAHLSFMCLSIFLSFYLIRTDLFYLI